uniref:NAD(P)H-quinone oxidoreductase subunit 6, chloroplastic n=1 Tax=Saccoloma inaequale TaxID=262953 RepID=A0A5B9RNC6_9MONI|nr:NADH-plastoquinone oxidoreductase subunit 6 [Saccoloma inaequale]QEG57845.1 NADH-plastoquinone oxidoreductase subunit 6 [Saccoloma inaequale]
MNLFELIHQIILTLIESGIPLGSLSVVLFPNVVHSAFSPGSVFTRISLPYFVLNADSVAAAQPLVYVGAINVLIVSAVMVTHEPTRSSSTPWSVGYFTALGVCIVLFLELTNVIYSTEWFDRNFIKKLEIPSANIPESNVRQLGYNLLSKFLIPFELASTLLLVALVGAIGLARDEEGSKINESSSVSTSRDNSSFF